MSRLVTHCVDRTTTSTHTDVHTADDYTRTPLSEYTPRLNTEPSVIAWLNAFQGSRCCKNCRKFQPAEYGARALQTDRRQTDGRQHIANVNTSSRSLIKRTVFDMRTVNRETNIRTHSSFAQFSHFSCGEGGGAQQMRKRTGGERESLFGDGQAVLETDDGAQCRVLRSSHLPHRHRLVAPQTKLAVQLCVICSHSTRQNLQQNRSSRPRGDSSQVWEFPSFGEGLGLGLQTGRPELLELGILICSKFGQ